MTISLSHLEAQRFTFRTWMQIEAHNYKRYFKEYHDIEKHDWRNLDVLLPIIVLVHQMKWNEPFLSSDSPSSKWNHEKLKGGRSMMKSMEIEDHGDIGISNN
jgi:hypothetical protein